MTNEKKQKIFFPNLDGLRFFSFFIVFLAHSFTTDNPEVIESSWYQLIKVRMFTDGDIGVSFFFVLSGFLISFLLMKEKELTGRIDIRSFYIRRILRIWPLYYFVVVFGFLIFPFLKIYFGGVPNETADPVLCSTFLNNFDRIFNGKPDASVLGGLWTIAIEEQFYVIWPVLFMITPVRHYKYIFITVLLLSTVFRILFVKTTALDLHTMGVITDMAIGGLGAYLAINNRKFITSVENLPKAVIVIPYLLTLFYMIFKHELFSSLTGLILRRLVIASTFILIILEQNYAKNSFFKAGNFKLISTLGKYTYGLYCLHGIGILISVTLLRKFSFNDHSWQLWFLELPLSLLISVTLSWLSYRYFESWFLKLKSKFSYISKD